MSRLTVRKAEVSDVDETYLVIKQCNEYLMKNGFDNWSRYDIELITASIQSDQTFVLCHNDEIAGTVMISDIAPDFYTADDERKWEAPGAEVFYFTALGVLPKYHSKGWGSQLLTFVEDYARSRGADYLRMTLNSENSPLKNYYLKRGFSIRQTREVSSLDLTLSFGEKKLLSTE